MDEKEDAGADAVNVELIPSVTAPQINFKLLPSPDKPGMVLPEPLVAPYAFGFDAASGFVTDFHAFNPETPLVMLKASFSNVLEAFVQEYKMHVAVLFNTAADLAKKLGQPKGQISGEVANMCRGRADMRLEEGQQRLMQWDGTGELMVQLPYAVIAEQGEAPNTTINMRGSRIYVNGLIWVISHRAKT